jgi:hypothetical protein
METMESPRESTTEDLQVQLIVKGQDQDVTSSDKLQCFLDALKHPATSYLSVIGMTAGSTTIAYPPGIWLLCVHNGTEYLCNLTSFSNYFLPSTAALFGSGAFLMMAHLSAQPPEVQTRSTANQPPNMDILNYLGNKLLEFVSHPITSNVSAILVGLSLSSGSYTTALKHDCTADNLTISNSSIYTCDTHKVVDNSLVRTLSITIPFMVVYVANCVSSYMASRKQVEEI